MLKVQEKLCSSLAGIIDSIEKIDSNRKDVPVHERAGNCYHLVVFPVKIILHFYRQGKCIFFEILFQVGLYAVD